MTQNFRRTTAPKIDSGLTLIQLMIVIAAIGIVASMAFRALSQHGF
jgi:prepilin-type N-terminal cleavage/methylation domain-containing protein